MNRFSAVCLLVAFTAAVQGSQIIEPLTDVQTNGVLTVGGVSAGGYFAGQYSVAFSASVNGFYQIAGGPWGCAQGLTSKAIGECMKKPEDINLERLYDDIFAAEDRGKIDAVPNISNQRMYFFSGTLDSVVVPGVMEAAKEFWSSFGPANLEYVGSVSAEHSYPTDNFGNDCTALSDPYINNCNRNIAFEAMNSILGGGLKSPVKADKANFIAFDQSLYTDKKPSKMGLGDTGYVYVPSGCKKTSDCPLHVEFHGCLQGDDVIGATYRENVGIIEVAEANNIVVLFPQAAKVSINFNRGCYDWYGYTSSSKYLFNDYGQLAAVKKMVDHLQ